MRTRNTHTPCRCIPLSTFQEEKPVWQPFYAERGSVHMYSTLAARGMGPEPRRISAASGGEGRGVWRRGVDSQRSRETERGRKYRPNYGAAPMRNVSTIQLLLSKYLMWPGRLSAQCPPAFRSLPAAGDQFVLACTHTRRNMCVKSRVMQVLTVNGRTCARMECVCTLSRVLLCSCFLSLAAPAMTSRCSAAP